MLAKRRDDGGEDAGVENDADREVRQLPLSNHEKDDAQQSESGDPATNSAAPRWKRFRQEARDRGADAESGDGHYYVGENCARVFEPHRSAACDGAEHVSGECGTEDANNEEGEDRCDNPEFGEQGPVAAKQGVLWLGLLTILVIHFFALPLTAGALTRAEFSTPRLGTGLQASFFGAQWRRFARKCYP